MTDIRRKKSEKPVKPIEAGGEHYELSGDFRGAVINIKSTLVSASEVVDIESLPPEPGEAPYQGLQFFGEKEADRFFGREMLTARVVGRLKRTRFLAVIGASGSGKSSLVRAGVIPAIKRGSPLADGGTPPADSASWAVEVVTPSAHPLDALAAVLTKDSGSLAALNHLQAELFQDTRSLTLAARQVLARRSASHLLLVVDQFEELYTVCRSIDERQAFIANILNAVDPNDTQPVTVVIVLRADFYAYVAQDDQLREMVSQYQEFIGAMNRDELVSAIDKPLALGGWKIQEGLIEVILDDVGYEPGALPLLSHALLETWRRRRGRTLTLSAYTEVGGIRGAIAETAENVFRRQLSADQQPIARMIFLRMSEVGEDSHDTRRRATFSELITRATDELVIQSVINILVEARLVTLGFTSPDETKYVEVAHEALIREWPTLRQWLAEDRAGLIIHQDLADDAREWVKLEKDPGVLYRGIRLHQAAEWAEKNPNLLSLQEGEFLHHSRRQEADEREQARRLQRARSLQVIFIAVTAVMLVAIGLLAYRFYYVKEPAVMDGLYNIAVAGFPQNISGQADRQSPSLPITDIIYQTIEEQIGDNPSILIWRDSPELRQLNVEIGNIDGISIGERAAQASVLAARLGANMIVYPALDLSQPQPSLGVEFFLAPGDEDQYADIQGGFRVGLPLPLSSLDDTDAQQELARQAAAMTSIALGLTEDRLGHSLEALEEFLKAGDFLAESPVIHFFTGRAYLFLAEREQVLSFARDELQKQAKESFERAIQLDPAYARAHVGLGGVYFKQAQENLMSYLENPNGMENPEPLLETAMLLAETSSQSFRAVIDNQMTAPETELPIANIARLGLGNSLRLQGEIEQSRRNTERALELFNQSITTLEPAVPDFKGAAQVRYLAQAYEYLGSAFQWKGYTLEVLGDYEHSLEAYRSAVEFYDRCIAQSGSTQDIIVKNEIIGDICMPNRSDVLESIDSLARGQG